MSGGFSRVYARASGMPLLVALLVVTFAIAADLAHEAWATAQSQQRTAERAAHDFVHYAATSVADEAQGTLALAFRALFGDIVAAPADSMPGPEVVVRTAGRIARCRCAPALPARYYWRLTLGSGDLQIAGGSQPSADEQRWLRDTIGVLLRSGRPAGTDGAMVFRDAPQPRIVAYTTRTLAVPHEEIVYGMAADVAAIGEAVVAPLPRRRTHDGVADAPAFDSLMRVFVLAPGGRRAYEANPRHVPQRVTMVPRTGHETYLPGVAPLDPVVVLADTVALGPEYGDLAVDVALGTSDPAVLFVDGVPRSRLLVLLGLLVLMAGLVAAAVLQLRREHELARLRADLTAGVSHELRTPLAQIMLYGETLMLDRTRSERERRAAAEVIVREARRLMHLVENALHFARADRRVLALTPEAIDVAALTRDILVSFAPLAWAAQVTLREAIDAECPAVIDAAAYRQIVLNLLENAVRYGPVGQTITVGVARLESVVRLSVTDQGPGVDATDRERIWAPFVRLRSARQGPLGTGIGLAVVRDLTLRHGGRAWVERGEGGGARFIVELPATRGGALKDTGQDSSRSPRRLAL